MLHVEKLVEYEGWHESELAKVVASNPEKYGLEMGTKQRALAMVAVAGHYKKLHASLAQEKEIVCKIKVLYLVLFIYLFIYYYYYYYYY